MYESAVKYREISTASTSAVHGQLVTETARAQASPAVTRIRTRSTPAMSLALPPVVLTGAALYAVSFPHVLSSDFWTFRKSVCTEAPARSLQYRGRQRVLTN